MIQTILCKLGLHVVPQYRHRTGAWLWGSAIWSRNCNPYCIHCDKGREINDIN